MADLSSYKIHGLEVLFKAVFFRRKSAALHILPECFHCLERLFLEIRILLYELRREPVEQPQEVVEHQHLAVAVRACADPDGRDMEQTADLLCERGRHGFEHDSEGACVLHCTCISQDLLT